MSYEWNGTHFLNEGQAQKSAIADFLIPVWDRLEDIDSKEAAEELMENWEIPGQADKDQIIDQIEEIKMEKLNKSME